MARIRQLFLERSLAVFTGEACLWCRVLEKQVFADAEVADLSRNYVCVEVSDTGDDARTWEAFHIASIPQSFILTAAGQRIDHVKGGDIEATAYAAWLREGLSKRPRPKKNDLVTPPDPVGADAEQADIAIWFTDNDAMIGRWNEPPWTEHRQLMTMLERVGLRPRIEHVSVWEFSARWDRAIAEQRLPEMLASTNFTGTLQQLEKAMLLRSVLSARLDGHPERATCQDFSGRFVWLVREVLSDHKDRRFAQLAEDVRNVSSVQLVRRFTFG